VTQINHNDSPHKAVDAIYHLSKGYAQAKANRVYLEQFRKSKKALLINECAEGTGQTRESYAYAHPEYIELLEGLKVAVEKEQECFYKLKAAELRIDVWRTMEASNRKGLDTSSIT